jgi:hypothetical protein
MASCPKEVGGDHNHRIDQHGSDDEEAVDAECVD